MSDRTAQALLFGALAASGLFGIWAYHRIVERERDFRRDVIGDDSRD